VEILDDADQYSEDLEVKARQAYGLTQATQKSPQQHVNQSQGKFADIPEDEWLRMPSIDDWESQITSMKLMLLAAVYRQQTDQPILREPLPKPLVKPQDMQPTTQTAPQASSHAERLTHRNDNVNAVFRNKICFCIHVNGFDEGVEFFQKRGSVMAKWG